MIKYGSFNAFVQSLGSGDQLVVQSLRPGIKNLCPEGTEYVVMLLFLVSALVLAGLAR